MHLPENDSGLLNLLLTYQDRLRKQLLIDIFNNKNLHGSTMAEVGEYYGFGFPAPEFTILVYHFVDRLSGSAMRKRQAMEHAAVLLEQTLLPQIPEGVVCVTDDLLLCLISIHDLSACKADLDSSFDFLLQDEMLKDFHCVMGAGMPGTEVADLRPCFDSAVAATEYGVLFGYGKWYPSVSRDSSPLRSVPISPRQLSALQTALSVRSEELLETWVRDAFRQAAPLFEKDPTYAYLLPRNISQRAYVLTAGSPGAEILAHGGDRLDSCISVEEEQQALIELFRQFCAADRRELNPAVILIQNHLQYHFHEPVSLEDLSQLTGLNPQYLSVLFKKETGRSVTAYIRDLRLSSARELLRSTSLTIGQIAETVGYEDPLYFSRVFQKEYRQSPRNYRNGAKQRNA